ncbi:hypothetical protein KR044_005609, partial [Drosophila immigrans]
VRSEDNPADLASRGVTSQELIDSSMWWHGPEWLKFSEDQWPVPPCDIPEVIPEQRVVKCHMAQAPACDLLERFSKFDRALRVVAYIRRFIQRCRQPGTSLPLELSCAELAEVQTLLVLQTQRQEYAKEYGYLLEKKPIPRSSSILNLNPFLDQKGVIRSCGRVNASESLTYDERHPIILPYSCRFSRLLIHFTHSISLHGGNQLMIRLIRAKYWIPKLKTLAKSVVNSCKVCIVHRKKLQTQLMGTLPTERASFSNAFHHTGVDFAGPFEVKNYTGRACLITKGYVCVFVCFSTKAIHLEPTSDLTADKFLAAFSRF